MAQQIVFEFGIKGIDQTVTGINRLNRELDLLLAKVRGGINIPITGGGGAGGAGGGGGGMPGGGGGGPRPGPVPGTGRPPIIPGLAPTNWRLAGLGAAASIFSPYVGSRLLNQAFSGGGAGGGGVGGRLFGGSVGGFGAIYTGLVLYARILSAEFHLLADAVRRASKLFLDASLVGKSPGALFGLQAAGRSIGISPEQINRLAAQQNLLSPGRTINASGEMLRAARSLGDSELATKIQQNLKLIDQIFGDFSHLSGPLNAASRNLWEFEVIVGNVADLLKGSFMIAVGDLIKPLTYLAYVLEQAGVTIAKLPQIIEYLLLAAVASMFPLGAKIWQELARYLPNVLPNPTKDRTLAGPAVAGPVGAWEKMGLIINGGIGGANYAQQTAQNTKRIADAVTGKYSGLPPTGNPNNMFHAPP